MVPVVFDEATHTYRVAGVVVPSVTQILSDLSVMKRLDPAVLAEGRVRGRMVHHAVDLYNRKDLDEDSLDDSLKPYVTAWKRFCRDMEYEPEINEQILYSARWMFAGTPDTMGTWKQLRRRPKVLIDVKTGAQDPCHGPQTAAYVELLRENGLLKASELPQRAIVRLQPTGFYKVDPMMDPGDWSTFMAALVCHKFKERQGLL